SADDLLIPLGEILRAARADGGFWNVGLGHNEARYLNRGAEIDQPRFFPTRAHARTRNRARSPNDCLSMPFRRYRLRLRLRAGAGAGAGARAGAGGAGEKGLSVARG